MVDPLIKMKKIKINETLNYTSQNSQNKTLFQGVDWEKKKNFNL